MTKRKKVKLPTASPDDDPSAWVERAVTLLAESLDRWEGEEESVKEEKADHIAELNQFFNDWNAWKRGVINQAMDHEMNKLLASYGLMPDGSYKAKPSDFVGYQFQDEYSHTKAKDKKRVAALLLKGGKR